MKKIGFVVSMFCVFVFANTETEKVQNIFQVYRTALLSQDGSTAWSAVDEHTHQYYDEVAGYAKSIKKSELEKLDFMTKLMVLRLRMEFRADTLMTLSGRDVFEIGINRKWTSPSTIQAITQLDSIAFHSNLAQGYINQAPGFPVFYFVNESSGWKLFLFKSLELGNIAFKQQISQSGMNETDYLIKTLQLISSRDYDPQIFEGPLK